MTSKDAPSLIAITLHDQYSQERPSLEILADLPCTLPTLRYFGWQSKASARVLYQLERKDDKVVAVHIQPFNVTTNQENLFPSEAVLDHFGQAARGW